MEICFPFFPCTRATTFFPLSFFFFRTSILGNSATERGSASVRFFFFLSSPRTLEATFFCGGTNYTGTLFSPSPLSPSLAYSLRSGGGFSPTFPIGVSGADSVFFPLHRLTEPFFFSSSSLLALPSSTQWKRNSVGRLLFLSSFRTQSGGIVTNFPFLFLTSVLLAKGPPPFLLIAGVCSGRRFLPLLPPRMEN